MERAQTQVENNVRVTAAVLSAEESKAMFGLPLYKKAIQPIWLEIENNDEERVWFSPVGVDPKYFPPLEVAYMNRFRFSKEANQQMEQYFNEQAMGLYIEPGRVRSGFVFTNLDVGTKSFNVDLVGEDHQVRTFTFLISVPGFRASHHEVDWHTLYSKDEMVSYDEAGQRKALESLPCCATNEDGTKMGEPINVVIIGNGEDVLHALIQSGWDETESQTASRTEVSSIFSGEYRYAPVSLLYLYGRPQDAAFRKSRETAREQNQLRLWLSPMTFEGKPVWVGQISREVRVRSLFRRYKIEPNLDEARTYILQDILYSQGLAKYGHVKGVGAAPISNPRQNLTGNSYFTDGYRVVLWVSSDPISFPEVEVLEWEIAGPR
ncbi:MAG: hypothetical protein GTO14_01595 [Anaerolineales bacterium]|nr:hypothetical protein [Anaerolineales bacterium]